MGARTGQRRESPSAFWRRAAAGMGARTSDERGFTLVELLVVMIIIGLLAAIATPSFLSQRTKAQDADAKAGARTAMTAIETYATDHGGRYVAATAILLAEIDPTIDPVAVTVDSADADTYELTVSSASGNSFSVERLASGSRSYLCTIAEHGGCPAGGAWG